MNNQIDKLWGEALDKAMPSTYSNLTLTQVEKIKQVFAELIVRECANMLDEDSYLMPELGGYAHDMRKRFGVEE